MNIGLKVSEMLDFNSPMTPRSQVQAMYAATVAARLGASRSKEEFRETIVRDLSGWVTLFYLASIVENTVGYLLDKASPACKQGKSLIKGQGEKSFLSMLNPLGKHKVRSFEDIEAIKNVIKPENYKSLMRNKSIVFVVGLLSSILTLGLFIPWLNVQLTRKEVLEKGKCGSKQSFSPKVNLTLDPNFKPNQMNLNRMG